MRNFLILVFQINFVAAAYTQVAIYDSGGPLHPDMSIYDINYHRLNIEVFPDLHEIEGEVTTHASITHSSQRLAFNLDTVFQIKKVSLSVNDQPRDVSMHRENGIIYLQDSESWQSGDQVSFTTHYRGKPLAADVEKLSWSDGFFWDTTASGKHWITNVTVLNGADIWWPCKDHPSDEPDSVDLIFTVPQDLVVASNGRLRSVTDLVYEGKKRYHWHVSTPINNYNITINAAPYVLIDSVMTSITGEQYPIEFYVLPEFEVQGKKLFPQFGQHLDFFEQVLGPYPFRSDKYGVAQTSYFGMENQSIIAYGNNFTNNAYGFDYLHFHELAHEWFANMVTCKNWKDWWIHEGLASYMESLYVEHLHGKEAYHEYANGYFSRLKNEKPVSPLGEPSCREQYISDVYSKGAAIMHNARYLIGDEVFFRALRRLAYPDPKLEKVSSGSQCRLSSTEEYIDIFESQYGDDLKWYFHAVLRYADLPELKVSRKKNKVNLLWETKGDPDYTMPVQVQVGEQMITVEMKKGKGKFKFKSTDYQIDPNNWLLKNIIEL